MDVNRKNVISLIAAGLMLLVTAVVLYAYENGLIRSNAEKPKVRVNYTEIRVPQPESSSSTEN